MEYVLQNDNVKTIIFIDKYITVTQNENELTIFVDGTFEFSAFLIL